MNDKIKTEIEKNNLDTAKIEIQKLEQSLKTEKSDYVRCKTLEKINIYKNLYSQKIIFPDKNLDNLDFTVESGFEAFETKDVLSYTNVNDKTLIPASKYSSGKITKLQFCTIEYFEIRESLVLENCENCTIFCKTKQLRIKNSHNLNLHVFIEAGISLENSSEIKIACLQESSENKLKNVKDFTNPFNSENFSFVDDQ